MIGLGLGLLRLSPRDFWAMTPRELLLAVAILGGGRAEPPSRQTIERLMALYPDGIEDRR